MRDFICRGEIDVALYVFVRRTMFWSTRPRPFALDHIPPHAGKFARLDIADVTQFVRLI